jgi:hypothetical protein
VTAAASACATCASAGGPPQLVAARWLAPLLGWRPSTPSSSPVGPHDRSALDVYVLLLVPAGSRSSPPCTQQPFAAVQVARSHVVQRSAGKAVPRLLAAVRSAPRWRLGRPALVGRVGRRAGALLCPSAERRSSRARREEQFIHACRMELATGARRGCRSCGDRLALCATGGRSAINGAAAVNVRGGDCVGSRAPGDR